MQTFMKKLLALTAAVCLFFGLMPASVHAEGSDAGWGNYLALGDSISSGYGLGEGESSFPTLMGSAGLTVNNKAEAGETSQSLLAKLPGLSQDIAAADVITITIGGNDLMGALYRYLGNKLGVPADAVEAALKTNDTATITAALSVISGFPDSEEAADALSAFTEHAAAIISTIRGMNSHACIIVPNQYNPYERLGTQAAQLLAQLEAMLPFVPDTVKNMVQGIQTVSGTFDLGVQKLNQIYSSLNQVPGCYVADVYSAFKQADTNPCNASVSLDMATFSPKLNLDFHPNAEGHKLIAAAVTGKLTEAKGTMDALLEAGAAAVTQALASLFADGSVVTDQTSAQTWAETQVAAGLAALNNGVSADVQVTDFKAAQAGTEDKPEGTDGSMTVSIVLNYYGYTLAEPVTGTVQVKAAAYTAPEETPDPEDPVTTPEDDTDKDTGKTPDSSTSDEDEKTPSVKPVTTDKTTANKTPQTGDNAPVWFYALLVLAAGACIPAALKRKSGRR